MMNVDIGNWVLTRRD